MELSEIIVFIFLLLVVISILSTVVIITKNRKLSKREKTNLIFIQIILPVLGAFIYMIYNKRLKTVRQSFIGDRK
jgi:glucan phosphoethanolaminetransferase (alkaline phosphatase superfamily)